MTTSPPLRSPPDRTIHQEAATKFHDQRVILPHWVHYDIADNRIDLRLDDGGTSSLWWATKNEWLGLLDVANLNLEALYGNFDRSPLNDQRREYIFVAVRY